jgi:hypothetical protein
MHKSMAEIVKSAWRRCRFPLGYFLVVLAVVLRYQGSDNAVLAALLAIGLVLLPILSEIHSAVTASQRRTVFPKFGDAGPYMDQAISAYMKRQGTRTIRCLGVVLHYQGSRLNEILTQLLKESQRQVVIEVAMLDPTWEMVGKLSDTWPTDSAAANLRLRSFMQEHTDSMLRLGWTMRVHTYRFVPHWYGILVGDEVLFLGTTYWEGGKLSAGRNSVEVFRAANGSRDCEVIQEFLGWFAYSCQPDVSSRVLSAD